MSVETADVQEMVPIAIVPRRTRVLEHVYASSTSALAPSALMQPQPSDESPQQPVTEAPVPVLTPDLPDQDDVGDQVRDYFAATNEPDAEAIVAPAMDEVLGETTMDNGTTITPTPADAAATPSVFSPLYDAATPDPAPPSTDVSLDTILGSGPSETTEANANANADTDAEAIVVPRRTVPVATVPDVASLPVPSRSRFVPATAPTLRIPPSAALVYDQKTVSQPVTRPSAALINQLLTKPVSVAVKIPERWEEFQFPSEDQITLATIELFRAMWCKPTVGMTYQKMAQKLVEHNHKLMGSVLMPLVELGIQEMTVQAKRSLSDPAHLYLQCLGMIRKLNRVEMHQKTREIQLHFNFESKAPYVLQLPAVDQYVMVSKDKKDPFLLTPGNTHLLVKSEAVTFRVPKPLIRFRLSKDGVIELVDGDIEVAVGAMGIGVSGKLEFDSSKYDVYCDYKSEKPVLQVDDKGKPLIEMRNGKRYYVPFRARNWFKLAITLIKVKLPLPDIPQTVQEAQAYLQGRPFQPLPIKSQTTSVNKTAATAARPINNTR